MEKEFIPSKLALKLKELGFDEPCLFLYNSSDDDPKPLLASPPEAMDWNTLYIKETNKHLMSAPTFSQAFRFFREKYGLHRHICYFEDTHFWHGDLYRLKDSGLMNYPMELTEYKTYEEAELACLKKLIEIVKNLK